MKRLRQWSGTVATTALITIASLRSLILDSRMPGFQHDWSFPLTRLQVTAEYQQYFHPWLNDNFGLPNFYGFAYPVAAWYLFFNSFLTPHGVVVLTLSVALMCAGLGAASLASLLVGRVSGLHGPLAAAVYLTLPFAWNELGAGHISELIAFSLLPWFLVLLLSAGPNAVVRTIGCGLLAAAMAIQPQYAAFALLLAVVAALVRPALWIVVAGLIGIVLICQSATIATYVLLPSSAWLGVDAVTTRWELIQSADWSDAIAGTGYSYSKLAYGSSFAWMRTAEVVLSAAAILAIASYARRSVVARVLLISGVLCFFGAWGLRGPAQAPMEFAFEHIWAAGLFRELYHFNSVVTLCISVGGAACISAALLAKSPMLKLVGFGTAALAVLIAGAGCIGNPLDRAPRVDREHVVALSAVVDKLAREPGTSRVLFVPSIEPMGPVSRPYGGVDPDAFMLGQHPAISAFQPTAEVEFAGNAVFGPNSSQVREALAALGIQYVVVRKDWRSKRFENMEPGQRAIGTLCEPPRSTVPLDLTFTAGDLNLYAVAPLSGTWRSFDPPPVFAGRPPVSIYTDDPRTDWVQGARWAECFRTLAAFPYDSSFTIGRRDALVSNPGRARYIVLWAPDGAIVLVHGRAIRVTQRTPSAVDVGRAERVIVQAHGRTAVWGVSDVLPMTWAWRCRSVRQCHYLIYAMPQSHLWRPDSQSVAANVEGRFPSAWLSDGSSDRRLSHSPTYDLLGVLEIVQYNAFTILIVAIAIAARRGASHAKL